MAHKNNTTDEILEFIWTAKEAGSVRIENLKDIPSGDVTPQIIELASVAERVNA